MLILYNPPSSRNRKPVLPMSLLALGALLEETEEYLVVDGNLEADPVAALDRVIGETGADILGVTVMPGPQLSSAAPLCRALKELHPGLTIVWGGYFPTQHHEACLRSGYVDFVVVGHGEVAFKELVDVLRRGEDPRRVPGVAFLDSNTGEPALTPGGAIPHPDQLPDFPYHRVEMSRYLRRTFMGDRTISHHSSYGCPFSCSFCAVVNMTSSRWLSQSADRTARAVHALARRWGADSVEFQDNNFFVNEARTAEFAARIMDLGIAWWGEARVDTLLDYSEATWVGMRQSGLRMVFLGAESGSEETLGRMNKGGSASTAKTLALAEKMRRYGIVPEFSFVVGNPPDPEADARRTLEFIRQVKVVNPASEIILYMYTPVPVAGELYESARDCGFQFPATLDEWISREWQQFAQRRSASVPWVGRSLRRQIHDFERVLNARYPTVTNPRLHGWRRALLQLSAAWRYHLRIYPFPLELRILQRLLNYQRPETSGF